MSVKSNSPETDDQSNDAVNLSFQTSKLDEIEEVASRVVSEHRLVPLPKMGRVDAGFDLHVVGGLGLFNIRYGVDVIANSGPQSEDHVVFMRSTVGAGQISFKTGEAALTPQEGVVFISGDYRFVQYAHDMKTRVFIMSRTKLEGRCARLLGREIDRRIEFDRRLSLITPSGLSWHRLVDYAAGELMHPNSLIRNIPAARHQLEQMLISTLLLSHQNTYSAALLRPQSAAPYYVKQAEAYIEAHFSEPLSLADIAAHAGVSARSLQNGFQSFRGLTPMAFLRQVRIERAHKALLVADPRIATVTEIALSCGFNHMGEFAALYKKN